MFFLAGLTVILAYACSVFYFGRFIVTIRMNEYDEINKKNLNEILYYKKKMIFIFLISSIALIFLGVFGNLYNCIFISWKARVSCVEQYLVLFGVFTFLDYFVNKKEKYKVNKLKLNIKKDITYILLILIFCLISTITNWYFLT